MITANNDLRATSILTVHSIVHGKDSLVNWTAMLGHGGTKKCMSQQLGSEVERQGKAKRSTTSRTTLSLFKETVVKSFPGCSWLVCLVKTPQWIKSMSNLGTKTHVRGGEKKCTVYVLPKWLCIYVICYRDFTNPWCACTVRATVLGLKSVRWILYLALWHADMGCEVNF